MSFLVSNGPIDGESVYNFNGWNAIGDIKVNTDYLLAFDGTDDCKRDIITLLEGGLDQGKLMSLLENRSDKFCGTLLTKSHGFFFTDKIGFYDLFLYNKDDDIIISNKFNMIINHINVDPGDIDKMGLIQFSVFDHPLFNRTFHQNINYIDLGTVGIIKNTAISYDEYWEYEIDESEHFDRKNFADEIYGILNNAVEEYAKENSNEDFGLGLSGGVDSRILAKLAMRNNIVPKAFIFGEPDSDAYDISEKIADALSIDLEKIGYDAKFYTDYQVSLSFDPMMNLFYSWYGAIRDRLPDFDILLHGFNSDVQFGLHVKKAHLSIEDMGELVDVIINRYDEANVLNNYREIINSKDLNQLRAEMENELQEFTNDEFWKIKEEFNYRNRQRRFIKNVPSLHFYGRYPNFSPYANPQFIRTINQLPFEERVGKKFFKYFIKNKFPDMYKIRPERKVSMKDLPKPIEFFLKGIKYIDVKILKTRIFYNKSHKNVHQWLNSDDEFREFVDEVFEQQNEIFDNIFNKQVVESFLQSFNSFRDYKFLFRLITIKIWLDTVTD